MTPEQIEAFLAEPRNVIAGALRRDGRPQMTPYWFLWDGARFYISTTKARQQFKNLRRDPRVQLLFDDAVARRAVIVDGSTDIWEEIERGLPFFKRIRAKHGVPPADDDALRQRLQLEQRVLLVITPSKPIAEWKAWS